MDLLDYVEKRRVELKKDRTNSKKKIVQILKEPRNERISMRVTKSEKEFINKVASDKNVTITELFLNLIIKHCK